MVGWNFLITDSGVLMFIFNEDRAMKAKFSNLVVEDVNAPQFGRPVQTIWLDNDIELENLTYPSIIIANTGISYDPERAISGWKQLEYAPEQFPSWSGDGATDVHESPYWAFSPVPYNINYQIEVLARNNKHSTFLAAVLCGPDYFSVRHGYLAIPEDGTVRRLDLTAGPERQNTHDAMGKRLFHSVYTVNVSNELLPVQIETYTKVQTVGITVQDLINNNIVGV
jgi:hypothetical protein